MIEALVENLPILLSLVGLLCLSAFFSSSETAIFSLGPGSLFELHRSRPRTAELLNGLLENRRRLLVTLLLGNLVVNLAYFNLGALLTRRIAERAEWVAWSFPPLVLAGILVAGEIVPKMTAVRWPTAIASLASWPLFGLGVLLAVPRVILAAIATVIGRLIIGDEPEEGEVSSEELEQLLRAATLSGSIGRDEHLRLQAVLEFDRTRVKGVMTPRVQMGALPLASTRADLLQIARERGRSKIVLFESSLDDAHSYVDALELLGRPGAEPRDLGQPLVFVPESARVMDLLERFQAENLHIAVVVDEYGGTEGVVTREDLVEAVVGELDDESDFDPPDAVRDGEGGWLVSARLGLKAFERIVGRRGRELGVETVGGFVTAMLGRLPRVGERVRSGGVEFRVVETARRQPVRVHVSVAPRGESEGPPERGA